MPENAAEFAQQRGLCLIGGESLFSPKCGGTAAAAKAEYRPLSWRLSGAAMRVSPAAVIQAEEVSLCLSQEQKAKRVLPPALRNAPTRRNKARVSAAQSR